MSPIWILSVTDISRASFESVDWKSIFLYLELSSITTNGSFHPSRSGTYLDVASPIKTVGIPGPRNSDEDRTSALNHEVEFPPNNASYRGCGLSAGAIIATKTAKMKVAIKANRSEKRMERSI